MQSVVAGRGDAEDDVVVREVEVLQVDVRILPGEAVDPGAELLVDLGVDVRDAPVLLGVVERRARAGLDVDLDRRTATLERLGEEVRLAESDRVDAAFDLARADHRRGRRRDVAAVDLERLGVLGNVLVGLDADVLCASDGSENKRARCSTGCERTGTSCCAR